MATLHLGQSTNAHSGTQGGAGERKRPTWLWRSHGATHGRQASRGVLLWLGVAWSERPLTGRWAGALPHPPHKGL